jgi:hypothetical protein
MPYDRPLSKRNRCIFAKMARRRCPYSPHKPHGGFKRVAPNTPVEWAMTVSADVMTILAAGGAAFAALALFRGWAGLRHTTLIGAWSWAILSLAALAGVELAIFVQNEPALPRVSDPLRFAAAALTLCPTVAVLGAKRPQDRAWHWIVLSLWVVVCIPAVNSALFHTGGLVELHAAQGTFLWVLILLGLANYLPTRYAIAAICVAVGQVLLFSRYLPFLHSDVMSHARAIGIASYAVGLAASPLSWRNPISIKTDSLNSAWKNFRDQFGAFWAIRVLVRLNAAAETNRWPIRLYWSGFTIESAIDEATEKVVRRCLSSMLRRFV